MKIINYLPNKLQSLIDKSGINIKEINEIRIRTGRPVILVNSICEKFLMNDDGTIYLADRYIVEDCFRAINEFSIYAHADSIKQGFITLEGGHRAGFLGRGVTENDKIINISEISSLNIRIAREISGCSDNLVGKILDGHTVHNTLIISPPGFGKTTLLRDLVRNLSDGFKEFKGINVSVVDERSEIAAMHLGTPGNNIGIRTDVLDNVPKRFGMELCVRTMSPRVIVVDELGDMTEIEMLNRICKSGCSVIATMHGKCMEDVFSNPVMKGFEEKNIFSRFVILKDNFEYIVKLKNGVVV